MVQEIFIYIWGVHDFAVERVMQWKASLQTILSYLGQSETCHNQTRYKGMVVRKPKMNKLYTWEI